MAQSAPAAAEAPSARCHLHHININISAYCKILCKLYLCDQSCMRSLVVPSTKPSIKFCTGGCRGTECKVSFAPYRSTLCKLHLWDQSCMGSLVVHSKDAEHQILYGGCRGKVPLSATALFMHAIPPCFRRLSQPSTPRLTSIGSVCPDML